MFSRRSASFALAAALLISVLAAAGCVKVVSELSSEPASTAKIDPLQEQFKNLRTAQFQIDSAVQELNDAIQTSKDLAHKAGGDATKALAQVAEVLNGAGEALAEYENFPETQAEFQADFAAQDKKRLADIDVCLSALSKTEKASNILRDLSANVPSGFQQALAAIEESVSQIESDIQQAILSMGGQLSGDDSESLGRSGAKSQNP